MHQLVPTSFYHYYLFLFRHTLSLSYQFIQATLYIAVPGIFAAIIALYARHQPYMHKVYYRGVVFFT